MTTQNITIAKAANASILCTAIKESLSNGATFAHLKILQDIPSGSDHTWDIEQWLIMNTLNQESRINLLEEYAHYLKSTVPYDLNKHTKLPPPSKEDETPQPPKKKRKYTKSSNKDKK